MNNHKFDQVNREGLRKEWERKNEKKDSSQQESALKSLFIEPLQVGDFSLHTYGGFGAYFLQNVQEVEIDIKKIPRMLMKLKRVMNGKAQKFLRFGSI